MGNRKITFDYEELLELFVKCLSYDVAVVENELIIFGNSITGIITEEGKEKD